jgi:hypothetical protein
MTTCLIWPYFTVLLECHIRQAWLYIKTLLSLYRSDQWFHFKKISWVIWINHHEFSSRRMQFIQNYNSRFDLVWFIVFNATFNNISVISWQSVLLMEETWVPGENHWPDASRWQTLSHNYVVSSTPCHERGLNSQL